MDYYSMATGSLGFQIGGEAKDIIIAFNNDEALSKFRATKGWEAGVDGNFVMTGSGQLIEVQMSAEGATFSHEQMARLIELADKGVAELVEAQKAATA